MKNDLPENIALAAAAFDAARKITDISADHPPKQHQCPSRQPWRWHLTEAPATPERK